jgi:hypothetical protein
VLPFLIQFGSAIRNHKLHDQLFAGPYTANLQQNLPLRLKSPLYSRRNPGRLAARGREEQREISRWVGVNFPPDGKNANDMTHTIVHSNLIAILTY